MKWLVIQLLGVIFVALITGSIQSVTADHLEPGQGIFKDRSDVDLVTTAIQIIKYTYKLFLEMEMAS